MINLLTKEFNRIFNRNDGVAYFSPGRVNLIGEHIDYNGGFVFPAAISIGTYGIVAKREDRIFRVFSNGFSETIYEFDLNSLRKDDDASWVDYIKGVILETKIHGRTITHGFDLYIHGTMPEGCGLSSSASLECLVITILDDLNDFHLSFEQKATIGKATENNFIGLNSGIMDQFAVIAGKKGQAILLDTATLEYKYSPIDLGKYQLLVVNTNKKRELKDSKYNQRFAECQEALAIIKTVYNVNNICAISSSELKTIKHLFPPLIYKRALHAISEQERTLKSFDALQKQDIITFASCLTASHASLRDDYEVTGLELDTLQEALLSNGCLGARMTGAGFCGCAIAIAEKDKVAQIQKRVIDDYRNVIGYEPSFYVVNISDGTKRIQ